METQNTTHRKAFVYRLYPTRVQEQALLTVLDLTRELYNAALEERRAAWRKGKSLTAYDQMKLLGEVKAVRPEYQGVYAQVLQDTLKRLDKAFQSFFSRAKSGKKAGYPRFKGRGWWDSFTFPQVTRGSDWVGPGKPLGNGKVKVPGVGHVRMKQHRPLEGTPKTFTVKRQAGCWYAVYSCEVGVQALPPSEEAAGIDLGLISFVATSDGELVSAPRVYRKAELRLKRAQRALSQHRRGSNRRRKAKMRLARLHRKVANQRKDFHHKLARRLVSRYGLIAHEDLNLAGLQRSRLAKSFMDAGHANFIQTLTSKAASAGRRVVAVRPHHTSQICPNCGNIRKKELSERTHSCECGCVMDRDVAAAKVILGMALARTGPSGMGGALAHP